MESNERTLIDGLFVKLKQAEQQAGPRDPEAERQITEALSRQPTAPYYMSQVILIQEQAMQALNQRVQKLEQDLAERPAGGGGFLGGLFGGGNAAAERPTAGRTPAMAPGTPYGAQAAPGRGWSNQAPPAAGGGFMASAMQTAVGVAGGMMLANALGGMFGGEAKAAEAPAAEPPAPEEPADEPIADDGGDFDTFGDF